MVWIFVVFFYFTLLRNIQFFSELIDRPSHPIHRIINALTFLCLFLTIPLSLWFSFINRHSCADIETDVRCSLSKFCSYVDHVFFFDGRHITLRRSNTRTSSSKSVPRSF